MSMMPKLRCFSGVSVLSMSSAPDGEAKGVDLQCGSGYALETQKLASSLEATAEACHSSIGTLPNSSLDRSCGDPEVALRLLRVGIQRTFRPRTLERQTYLVRNSTSNLVFVDSDVYLLWHFDRIIFPGSALSRQWTGKATSS